MAGVRAANQHRAIAEEIEIQKRFYYLQKEDKESKDF